MAHALGCQRIQLYTNFDQPMREEDRARMRSLVQRRAKAEPVAYLIGHREFYSLDFKVTNDVLVPRPDTETLVMETLALLKESCPNPQLLEIGTGSGCISVTLAKNDPTVQITATDISPPALAIASENAATHQVEQRIQFLQGDLFAALEPLNAPRFHFLVSNPPYVTTGEMETLPRDIRDHEPSIALDGGSLGFDQLEQIALQAPDYLHPGGYVLVELASEQAEPMRDQYFAAGCWTDKRIIKDSAGHNRVVQARLSK